MNNGLENMLRLKFGEWPHSQQQCACAIAGARCCIVAFVS